MSTVQTTLNETEVKELLKQAVAEVLQEQRDFLYEVFLEALEDIALIQAIQPTGREHGDGEQSGRFPGSGRCLYFLKT